MDRGTSMIFIIWLLFAISGVFLGLRVYCRCRGGGRLWWDDWVMIFAFVCYSFCFVIHEPGFPLLADICTSPASFGRRSCYWHGPDRSRCRQAHLGDRPSESSETARPQPCGSIFRHSGLCFNEDILGSYDAENCKGDTRFHESNGLVSIGIRQRTDGSGNHPQLFGM